MAPICPLCKIRERSYDNEPGGEPSYLSDCFECAMLSGTRTHSHTYYGSPAQVAAGTYRADQSWRTTVRIVPTWDGTTHTGYRCTQFELCGWEKKFTAEELERCDSHSNRWVIPGEMTKGQCFDSPEHRLERGEITAPNGYLTEFGRQEDARRSDAENWDPGRYMPRT